MNKEASHLVDFISVHIQFDLERYLLNIHCIISNLVGSNFMRRTLTDKLLVNKCFFK